MIDSGATRSFIDWNVANRHPENMTKLENPIPLELFDGQPTSAGKITQQYKDSISFKDGTIQMVEFLVTRLHPTAPIVLGLPWLQKYNPDINWSDLSLQFRERNVKICAAMVGDLLQGPNIDKGDFPTNGRPGQVKKKPSVTIEDEIDSDFIVAPVGEDLNILGPDDPILVGINEWLLYGNLVDELQNDYEEWQQEFNSDLSLKRFGKS